MIPTTFTDTAALQRVNLVLGGMIIHDEFCQLMSQMDQAAIHHFWRESQHELIHQQLKQFCKEVGQAPGTVVRIATQLGSGSEGLDQSLNRLMGAIERDIENHPDLTVATLKKLALDHLKQRRIELDNSNGELDRYWQRQQEIIGLLTGNADVEEHSMETTVCTDFPEVKWAVPGILPIGLGILASHPKIGKSWIALNLCLGICRGKNVFQEYQVEQGPVLYLCLEMNERDLKDRVLKLLPPEYPAEKLSLFKHLHTWDFPKGNVREAGVEVIEAWLKKYPTARLVVIDTWAIFHPHRKRGANLYDEDYEMAGQLQQLAIKHDVAILVLHHTRKSGGADIVEEINGSFGLSGCADTVWVLHRKRGESDGELNITGRNVEEKEFAVRFKEGKWYILGGSQEVKELTEEQKIMLLFTPAKPLWTNAELAMELQKTPNAMKLMMWRMSKKGLVMKQGRDGWVVGGGV